MNHFEFKGSPDCLQYVQTSEHLGHSSARLFIRTFSSGLNFGNALKPMFAILKKKFCKEQYMYNHSFFQHVFLISFSLPNK